MVDSAALPMRCAHHIRVPAAPVARSFSLLRVTSAFRRKGLCGEHSHRQLFYWLPTARLSAIAYSQGQHTPVTVSCFRRWLTCRWRLSRALPY